MTNERYHTVVIGAGQAGLAMGFYLKQQTQSFIILDKAMNLGEEWSSRYDSLQLFTPRMYSSLPGMTMIGDPHGLPTKDEISNYLKSYAKTFHLPVKLNTEVIRVRRDSNLFVIETKDNDYKAINVIIATGPFQKPRIPNFAQNLAPYILQLHSSQYKNLEDLRAGNVLIVGGGNSGAQIAVEISKERETYLSISQKLRFMPLRIGNKNIFWWFDKLGVLKAKHDSWIGQKIRATGDPIFGYELQEAMRKGKVIQKTRAINGTDRNIEFQDASTLNVQNIIWATGFHSDYSWLDIDGVLNNQGKVMHNRGQTRIPGVFFLGLPWQYRRGSALLQGVGEDANYIMNHIR